jgi:hypothetical protein
MDWTQRFLDPLIELGIDADRKSGVSISALAPVAEALNLSLGLKGQTELVHSCTCGGSGSMVPIPPESFTRIGSPTRMVLWGLNPYFGNIVVNEKLEALRMSTCTDEPGTWETYAAYYVDDQSKFLTWAVKSPYYKKIAAVAKALRTGAWTPWSCLEGETALQKFTSATDSFGLMLAEFIPFHSPKAPTIDFEKIQRQSPAMARSPRIMSHFSEPPKKRWATGDGSCRWEKPRGRH